MNMNVVGRFCETPAKNWRPPHRTPYKICRLPQLEAETAGDFAHF
jgi:hypothetical protein